MPFFERIYNLSGYPDIVKTKGVDFTYQLAPRAKIFRRDAGTVKDMASMKKIMRYNGKFLLPLSVSLAILEKNVSLDKTFPITYTHLIFIIVLCDFIIIEDICLYV